MSTSIKHIDFGVVITTYIGCYYLTKGLLASIKEFMPNTPICMIVDGNFDIQNELDAYNITHIIRKEDVRNEYLRENCFGSRNTNMIAFWESPFEHFVYLDSDIVIWGDYLKNVPTKDFDFIHNTPHETYTEKIYKKQYFDYDKLFDFIPFFDWKTCHFFNAGVFIARRNCLDLDDFKKLNHIWKANKKIMALPPQSFINIMVFSNFKKGKLKVGEYYIQEIAPVVEKEKLEQKYALKNIDKAKQENGIAIHWAGIKPTFSNRNKTFSAPALYFRKKHLKNIGSMWLFLPNLHFWWEENMALLEIYYQGSFWKYVKRKIVK